MDKQYNHSQQSNTSILLPAKRLALDVYKREKESEDVRNRVEDFVAKHFWAKKEFLFYMKEVNHLEICDHSEKVEPPSSANDFEDELIKMDALCGDLLDSMDAIHNCLTARTPDVQRVGPILKRVVFNESEKVLSCNKRNNMIFSRCNEKRYIEHPSSRITNNQVMDLIQHIVSFGSSVMPDTPMSFIQLLSFLNIQNKLSIKNVSNTSFSKIRNLINKKLMWNPNSNKVTKYPYIQKETSAYSAEELKYIVSILEKDIVKMVSQTAGVQPSLPANGN